MDIRTIISRIHSLPESSLEKLEESLTRVDRPKGFRLTETGKVESNVFFLSEGIARAYLPVDGKEVTFWIGAEGSTLMSMKSFVNDEKGYETIELMEDSVLYMLERGQLYRLFEEDIHIANWGRKFAEKELLKTEERLIPLLFGFGALPQIASRQSGAAAPSAFGMPCLLFGHYAGQPEPDKGGVKMMEASVPGL